ncbi:hypothetical protein MRX96_022202 [Rhipicephalus microplus]
MPNFSGQKTSWKTVFFRSTSFPKTQCVQAHPTMKCKRMELATCQYGSPTGSGAGIALQQRTLFYFIYCSKCNVNLCLDNNRKCFAAYNM